MGKGLKGSIRFMGSICLFGFITLLISITAQAEEKEIRLEEIVVTATKTPHTLKDTPLETVVVNREDIAKTNAQNTMDVLKSIPGVSASAHDDTFGTYTWNARMRGLSFNDGYALILIDGQRAYDLARAGQEVEMKTRGVTVHSLDIVMPAGAGERLDSVTLSAHVSKGTYIRSLARDIALALNSVGHVTMLRRTKAGPFSLADAISLDNWADAANARALDTLILPFEAGLDDIPALSLSSGDAGAIRQGRVLAGMQAENGLYCAKDDNGPVALVELSRGNVRVVRGFNFNH